MASHPLTLYFTLTILFFWPHISPPGQCLLCQVQSQILLPPRLRISWPLRPLLRPQVHQAAPQRVQGSQEGGVLREVSQQRRHCLSINRFSTQVVECEPESLCQIIYRWNIIYIIKQHFCLFSSLVRSREREEFCWACNWWRLHYLWKWK